MSNAINWFEIPVTDMNRAIKFYSKVFSYPIMNRMQMDEIDMAFFPMTGEGVGGSLCKGVWYKPTQDGVVVYMNGGNDLSLPLSKIEEAGGKIIMPKKLITPEIGYMALFIDSEGNRIALHSPI